MYRATKDRSNYVALSSNKCKPIFSHALVAIEAAVSPGPTWGEEEVSTDSVLGEPQKDTEIQGASRGACTRKDGARHGMVARTADNEQ